MISSAIWKKHARVREVLKDLKIVFKRFFFFKFHEKSCYYLLIMCMEKFGQCIYNLRVALLHPLSQLWRFKNAFVLLLILEKVNLQHQGSSSLVNSSPQIKCDNTNLHCLELIALLSANQNCEFFSIILFLKSAKPALYIYNRMHMQHTCTYYIDMVYFTQIARLGRGKEQCLKGRFTLQFMVSNYFPSVPTPATNH